MSGRGAQISYHDPHVPSAQLNGRLVRSTPLTAEALKRFDCVVLLTNHSNVDYEAILRHAALIVDTRNQYSRAGRSAARVVKL